MAEVSLQFRGQPVAFAELSRLIQQRALVERSYFRSDKLDTCVRLDLTRILRDLDKYTWCYEFH